MLEDDEMLECYRHCAQIGGQGSVKNLFDKNLLFIYFINFIISP